MTTQDPPEIRAIRLEKEADQLDVQLAAYEQRLRHLVDHDIPSALAADAEAGAAVRAHEPEVLPAIAAMIDSGEMASLSPTPQWLAFNSGHGRVLGEHQRLTEHQHETTVAVTNLQGERDRLNRLVPALRGRIDGLRQEAATIRQEQAAAVQRFVTEGDIDQSTLAQLRRRFGLATK